MHHPDFLAVVDDVARDVDDGTEIHFIGQAGPVRMGEANASVLAVLQGRQWRPSREEVTRQIFAVVDGHGGEIPVEALCEELARRGWAEPTCSPESIGIPPGSIVRRRTETED